MKKIWKNNFLRIYLSAISLQNLGANIYNMIFVAYLANVYHSELLVGLAESIIYIPALFGIWLGFLADSTKKKSRWLIVFSLMQALAFLIVAFLIRYENYFIVAIIALLNIFSDILSTYLSNLMQPIFKYNVDDEDLEFTYSIISALSLGMVLGSQALGVWLLTTTDNNYALLAVINAVTFFAVALLYWYARKLMTYHVNFDETPTTIKEKLKQMYQSARHVFKQADNLAFLPTIFYLIISNILSVSVLVFMNIRFLTNPVLNLSYAQSIVVLNVVQILGSLFGGLSVNKLWKNMTLSQIYLLQSIVTLLTAIFGLTSLNSVVIIPWLGILTFCIGRSNPIFSAALIRHVPDEQLGQVNSFISSIVTLSLPLADRKSVV